MEAGIKKQETRKWKLEISRKRGRRTGRGQINRNKEASARRPPTGPDNRQASILQKGWVTQECASGAGRGGGGAGKPPPFRPPDNPPADSRLYPFPNPRGSHPHS